MDGSSSLPFPPPHQVFLRRPAAPHQPPPSRTPTPPPTPQPPPAPPPPPAAAAPPVHLFRPPPPVSFRHYSTNPTPHPLVSFSTAAVPNPPPAPPAPPAAGVTLPRPPQVPAAASAKAKAKAKAPKNETENAQADASKGETEPGHDKESTTGPVRGMKRSRKPKSSKHTLHMSDGQGTNEGDPGASLFSSNNCRYDSSLGLLTKKFINLLQGAKDGTLDLNKAAETLEVQKRRIYDITNVLEGVDLIEKKLKNMIRWKGFDMSLPKEIERQVSVLKADRETLFKEDSRLDDEIREIQEKLQALTTDVDKRKCLYLLKEDINKIPCFQGSTLIAINAPHGTLVEVLDPDGDLDFLRKRYQIVLRSSMGPIDCYIVSNHEERFKPNQQVAPDDLGSEVITRHSAALQQVDHNPNRELEKGENNAECRHPPEPSTTHEIMSGILRIIPSDADIDADYWLASDQEISMTDTWGT